LVEQWCNRGILLHHGRVVTMGPIKEVVAAYQRLIAGAPPEAAIQIAGAG